MPKARLRLILCSDDIGLEARRWRSTAASTFVDHMASGSGSAPRDPQARPESGLTWASLWAFRMAYLALPVRAWQFLNPRWVTQSRNVWNLDGVGPLMGAGRARAF